MKLKTLSRTARGMAIILVLLMTLSSCGVIIINRPDTEPPATTVVPETEAEPGQTTTAPPEEETTMEPLETESPIVETEPPAQVTFPSRIEEAEGRLDNLGESIDITGFTLIYAAANNTVDVIFSDQSSPLYAARTNRNAMIEEKYSSSVRTIYENAVTSDQLYEDIRVATSSGSADYYLDLIVLSAEDAGRFLAKGLLKDMRSLPFYDITEGAQGGNVGSSRYFDLGAGTDAPELLYAIYFNRALVGKDAEKMLYNAALDGKVTWEMLFTVASSLSGTEAAMAVTGGENTLPAQLAPSLAGIEFITKNVTGTPKVELTDDDTQIVDMVIESISKLSFYTPTESASARDKFVEGKIPYYFGTLSEMLDLYDESVEWGLLTIPSEKDLGAYAENRPVVCIPATNTKLEQTSIWMTALNAASGDWIRDQYRSVSNKEHIRDNYSCLTLNKILSQKAPFGFERVFAGYYEGLKDATYGVAGNSFASGEKFSALVGQNITAINKKLAKLP